MDALAEERAEVGVARHGGNVSVAGCVLHDVSALAAVASPVVAVVVVAGVTMDMGGSPSHARCVQTDWPGRRAS